MARISKGYDREEFLREQAMAANLQRAIDNKDFPTWQNNRTMYLTSCLETFMDENEQEHPDGWEHDTELLSVIAEIKEQAKSVFGLEVFVRVIFHGGHPTMSIVEETNMGRPKRLGADDWYDKAREGIDE